MHEVDNELDRRDFLKRGARVTAAAAATVLGTSAAQGAVPDDKKIAFTDALPTRKLGKTEVELPMLGYGGAAAAKKFGNPLSTEDRVKLVRHAYDSGIRYFDTAISISYGDSQAIIGKALKDVRDNVFITSKVDFWDTSKPDGRITKVDSAEVTRQVEKNLKELQSDYIDAVAVCSTDHTHAPASMAGLRAGKHVFCEKPLTHSIFEARTMAETVRGTNLATQMGNEAHSGPHYRRVVELVRSGAIGEVRDVHCWCDQAWGNMDRPQQSPPVPPNPDWDLWLGPAPQRPYHPCYHPVAWRNWWDFGNGRLGDMGCHMLDLPFWTLDLNHPLTVEADGPPVHPESTPLWRICHWQFPARGDLPPVRLTWYDGDKRPQLQKEHSMPNYREGTLFVGSEGMLIAVTSTPARRLESTPPSRRGGGRRWTSSSNRLDSTKTATRRPMRNSSKSYTTALSSKRTTKCPTRTVPTGIASSFPRDGSSCRVTTGRLLSGTFVCAPGKLVTRDRQNRRTFRQ
jgi:predicted dehydrogenase